MSLDQQLRDVLTEQAERYDASPPDFDAMMAGGLVLRRRRHRRITVGAVAGLAVIGAVTSGLAVGPDLWDTRGADPVDRPTEVVKTPDRTGTDTKLHFLDLDTGARTQADGFSPEATYAFSPDGTKVACSGPCFGKTGPLFVADADGGNLVELHVPPAVDSRGRSVEAEVPFYDLLWSPDGTKLLYQTLPWTNNLGNLVLHDVATDETTQLTDFGLEEFSAHEMDFDFHPDGDSVIFDLPRTAASDDTDLWSVPTTGGDPTLVLRDAASPGYLAEGQSIAYVEGDYDGGPVMIASNGNRRTLSSTVTGRNSPLWMSPDRSKILYLGGGEYVQGGIFVVDVASDETTHLYGNEAAWVGDDRLLVGCIPRAPAPAEEPTTEYCS